MLIGIDASRANATEKTGVEWYGYHVIRELAKLDQTNRYRLYSWEPLRAELAELPDNFQNIVIPSQRFWPHTALSAELRRNQVDRLFVPSHVVPRVHPRRTVVTVHDIGFRHFKENYSRYHYLSLALGTRWSVKWADTVVVPSRAVAEDVRKHYELPGSKLSVVPNGYDRRIFSTMTPSLVMQVLKRWKISDPYVLYLGRLETRKNLQRLLEAFYRLRDSGLFGGQLVLAGNPGVGYEEIRSLIAKRRDSSEVVQTGYVSDEERAALLTGARALLFPSLYEGFGIPILEGFAAGTPVLTSHSGAMAEVAGEAALLVDPQDVDSIHHGIERLLAEEQLTSQLTAKGTERVTHFSWERTAQQIHEIVTS